MSAHAAMAHERDSKGHTRNVSDFEMWNPQPNDAWVMPEDDTPLTFDELKTRTQQIHVDQVRDMVPFWMKGVEAAEKGEVLRMEDFLEKLASEDRWGVSGIDDPWGPSIGPWPTDHPWGTAVPGGQADPWGQADPSGWAKADDNRWGKPDDPLGKLADWAVDEDSTLSMRGGRFGSPPKPGRKAKKGPKPRPRDQRKDPHTFVEEIAREQAVDAGRRRRMHDFYEVH